MTESIKVNPSKETGAVKVAVDVVDNFWYPIYKIAYSIEGETPVQVSTTDPLPIDIYNTDGDSLVSKLVASQATTVDLLNKILIELRISNKYNELGFDETIEEDAIHEDRRR